MRLERQSIIPFFPNGQIYSYCSSTASTFKFTITRDNPIPQLYSAFIYIRIQLNFLLPCRVVIRVILALHSTFVVSLKKFGR